MNRDEFWGPIENALGYIGLEITATVLIVGLFLITGAIWSLSVWYNNKVRKGFGPWHKMGFTYSEKQPAIISRRVYTIFLVLCMIYPIGAAIAMFVIFAHFYSTLVIIISFIHDLIFTDKVEAKLKQLKRWMDKPAFDEDNSKNVRQA